MSSVSGIQNVLGVNLNTLKSTSTDRTSSFNAVFNAIMNQVNETNDLSNSAEEEEIKFAMGLSNSTHDLQIAQEKANISLSYTVALRKTILDAYKEIMNLQF